MCSTMGLTHGFAATTVPGQLLNSLMPGLYPRTENLQSSQQIRGTICRSYSVKNCAGGTSLVVQWLRLCTPNSGGLGLIPDLGARSHMPQLRACMPHLKKSCTPQQISGVLQLRPGTAKKKKKLC